MNTTEQFNEFTTYFKETLARTSIEDDIKEIVQGMRVWEANLTYPATVDILMENLFGTPHIPTEEEEKEKYVSPDFAVGLAWSNPLTDAEVILTLDYGLGATLRDHDGEGDELIPFWYWDYASDPDCTTKQIMKVAIDLFIYTCRDKLADYYKRVSSKGGYISKEEFLGMLS